MKKYTFLLKPMFYIFSLVFATWLVIKIEKIKPSDLGQINSSEIQKTNPIDNFQNKKRYLKYLFWAHKNGIIDSINLDKEVTFFLESSQKASLK